MLIRNCLLGLCLCGSVLAFAQLSDIKNPLDYKYSVRKTGTAFELQYGSHILGAVGIERQWKQLKLFKPHSKALFADVKVGLVPVVLSPEIGGWWKEGRTNLLFGGAINWTTDFRQNRWGISPFVGIKFSGFQIKAGVNLREPNATFKELNTFYLAARFVLVNDWKFKKKKKSKG